jgi:hypothetical protein
MNDDFEKVVESTQKGDFVYFDPSEKNRSVSSEEMENIYKLISYDIDMPDAFHVIFALQNKCSAFITKDIPLLNCLNLIKKDCDLLRKLKILNSKSIVKSSKF